MKRLALFSSVLLLVGVPFAVQAATVNPVVEYTDAQIWSDNRPFTLGYSFTTSVTFNLTALGAWDDGLGNNRQVGLWDSTGTLLVSTTVLSTDPVTGHFQYDPISYTLAPGSYVIAAEFLGTSGNDPFPAFANGVTSQAGYTWGTDLQLYGTGLNFPTTTTGGGYGANGILYADFATGTPEPGTLIMFGSGILGAAGLLRRKLSL